MVKDLKYYYIISLQNSDYKFLENIASKKLYSILWIDRILGSKIPGEYFIIQDRFYSHISDHTIHINLVILSSRDDIHSILSDYVREKGIIGFPSLAIFMGDTYKKKRHVKDIYTTDPYPITSQYTHKISLNKFSDSRILIKLPTSFLGQYYFSEDGRIIYIEIVEDCPVDVDIIENTIINTLNNGKIFKKLC